MKKSVNQKEQILNTKYHTKVTRNRPLNSSSHMKTEQIKTLQSQRDISSKIKIQQSKNSLYDDEFISYINQLCDIIKVLNNSNMSNFSLVKNLLSNYNKNVNEQNKTPKENEILNIKSINTSFNHIETAFNSFYSNAKVLFRKMKKFKNDNYDQKKLTNPKINIENSTLTTATNNNFNSTCSNFHLTKVKNVDCISNENNDMKKIDCRSSSQKYITTYNITEQNKKKNINNNKQSKEKSNEYYNLLQENLELKNKTSLLEKKNERLINILRISNESNDNNTNIENNNKNVITLGQISNSISDINLNNCKIKKCIVVSPINPNKTIQAVQKNICTINQQNSDNKIKKNFTNTSLKCSPNPNDNSKNDNSKILKRFKNKTKYTSSITNMKSNISPNSSNNIKNVYNKLGSAKKLISKNDKNNKKPEKNCVIFNNRDKNSKNSTNSLRKSEALNNARNKNKRESTDSKFYRSFVNTTSNNNNNINKNNSLNEKILINANMDNIMKDSYLKTCVTEKNCIREENMKLKLLIEEANSKLNNKDKENNTLKEKIKNLENKNTDKVSVVNELNEEILNIIGKNKELLALIKNMESKNNECVNTINELNTKNEN